MRFRFSGYENYSLKEQFPRGWVVASKDTEMVYPEGLHYGKFSKIGIFVRYRKISHNQRLQCECRILEIPSVQYLGGGLLILSG